MITKELIKKLVEKDSGVEDISIKSRKRHYVDLRSVYFDLCYDYCNPKQCNESIGKLVNKDHATVLHGRKLIKYILFTSKFTANKTYENVLKIIKKHTDEDCESDSEFYDLIKNMNVKDKLNDNYKKIIMQHWRLKHIRLVEKSHSVINNYKKQNEDIKNKLQSLDKNAIQSVNLPEYILKHLSEYTENDLLELFQTRLKPFKMLLDTRRKQKEIKNIIGAKLIR